MRTAAIRFAWHLGNAVGDVIHHINARDVLLLKEINCLTFLFAEDRDEHIRAGDFFASGRLHVEHRTLQHPLET